MTWSGETRKNDVNTKRQTSNPLIPEIEGEKSPTPVTDILVPPRSPVSPTELSTLAEEFLGDAATFLQWMILPCLPLTPQRSKLRPRKTIYPGSSVDLTRTSTPGNLP